MALGEPQSLQEVQLYQDHDSLLVILSHHVSTLCQVPCLICTFNPNNSL